MADRKQDLLGRLADLSEDAIQKLAEAPGADRVVQAVKGLGERVDELQRRTSGFEELHSRLAALEEKVEKLSKGVSSGGRSAKSGSAGSGSSASKKT